MSQALLTDPPVTIAEFDALAISVHCSSWQ